MRKIEVNKREKTVEDLQNEGVEWHREKIIDMVKHLENLNYLKFIYNVLIAFRKKWGI